MADDFLRASDDELIAAALQQQRDRRRRDAPVRDIWEGNSGFPFLQDGQPVAWVKYGTQSIMLDEANTQEYVYELLNQQPELLESIRVPQIYRVIQGDPYPTLIVMEYIHGRTVRQWLEGETSEDRQHLLWDRVLHTLSTFLAFQPPEPLPSPGPIGGGLIAHALFGEYLETGDAPRLFDSVQDLQTHVNRTIVSLKLYFLIYPNQLT